MRPATPKLVLMFRGKYHVWETATQRGEQTCNRTSIAGRMHPACILRAGSLPFFQVGFWSFSLDPPRVAAHLALLPVGRLPSERHAGGQPYGQDAVPAQHQPRARQTFVPSQGLCLRAMHLVDCEWRCKNAMLGCSGDRGRVGTPAVDLDGDSLWISYRHPRRRSSTVACAGTHSIPG